MHYNVIIIGSGPSGLTAALYAARANLAPVVIRGLEPGGLIATAHAVENYPGFPDAINGFDLATKMEHQAARVGATFIDGVVASVDFDARRSLRVPPRHTVVVDDGAHHTADTVIIATGAAPRRLGVPGEDRLFNRGVSYCAFCDGFFFKDKRILVVGGGNSAVEEGLFLTRFAREVVIVHRRAALRADPILQERAITHPKLKFVWNTVVTEIIGEHKVEAVRLHHAETATDEVLAVGAVFPYIGHIPNTRLFTGQLTLDRDGYIVTDGRTRTSVPGVFATGDVVDRIYRQVITAAGSGAQAAMEASWYLDAGDAGHPAAESTPEALVALDAW